MNRFERKIAKNEQKRLNLQKKIDKSIIEDLRAIDKLNDRKKQKEDNSFVYKHIFKFRLQDAWRAFKKTYNPLRLFSLVIEFLFKRKEISNRSAKPGEILIGDEVYFRNQSGLALNIHFPKLFRNLSSDGSLSTLPAKKVFAEMYSLRKHEKEEPIAEGINNLELIAKAASLSDFPPRILVDFPAEKIIKSSHQIVKEEIETSKKVDK